VKPEFIDGYLAGYMVKWNLLRKIDKEKAYEEMLGHLKRFLEGYSLKDLKLEVKNEIIN
jgi:hypothetical protein